MLMMQRYFEKCLNAEYTHTAEGGDYAIQRNGAIIFLLFQHSNGKEDWKNNFDFPITPYRDMSPKWYCHRGFLRVWKAMRDEIEEKVAEMFSESHIARIICIGYSHGAALSVLATEDMTYLYGDKCEVFGYGFGVPRVLWGIVPKEVKERLKSFKSVRNIPDIVTHVPPAIMGYKHAGTLVRIGEVRKYSPIKAHYAEAYIEELKAEPTL